MINNIKVFIVNGFPHSSGIKMYYKHLQNIFVYIKCHTLFIAKCRFSQKDYSSFIKDVSNKNKNIASDTEILSKCTTMTCWEFISESLIYVFKIML